MTFAVADGMRDLDFGNEPTGEKINFMNIYSTENIESIVKSVLKKEGMSAIVPDILRNLKTQIKAHKDSKKVYRKERKRQKRIISEVLIEEAREINPSAERKDTLDALIEDLDHKITEVQELIERCEREWNDEIVKFSKNLLIALRSKRQEPELREFLLFDKKTFTTKTIESKAIEQLIKEDIAKHYKRKPADRNRIIEQLKGLLDNKLPKCIIRADIKSFFESIPMDRLIRKLEEDGFVSPLTLWYLKKIILEVKELGGEGAPRGLSFSSYLTEIYMQKADDEIRNLPYVYFYQRYVDDIVILFSINKEISWPHFSKETNRYWTQVKELFEKEQLSLHEEGDKKSLIYSGKTNRNEFDYLGYKFIIDKGKLTVRLSSHRVWQYKEKITAIIRHYNKTARDNESRPGLELPLQGGERRRKRQQPLRQLFGQLSALTGNGMLKGPKSNILCGVYYSNQYLTSLKDLEDLDRILKHQIRRYLTIPNNLFRYSDDSDPADSERRIIRMLESKWSFVEGFKNKRFCKSSSYFNRLNQIDSLIR